MKKQLLTTISFLLLSFIGYSQSGKLWNSVTKSSVTSVSKSIKRASFPEDFSLFQLNETAFKGYLKSVASINSNSKTEGTIVLLPNIEGKMERFELFESSNFTPELQVQFPEIKAFAGVGIDDKYAQVRLSVDPNGIQAMIFRTDKDNEFIEPYSQEGKIYAVFNSSGSKSKLGITCHTDDQPLILSAQQKIAATNNLRSSAGQYKTMRLALSCNAEYTTFYGGTIAGALAGMNATMTRVNGVFEKELAVHLNLIANESSIIFTDATTDPYSDIVIDAAGNPDVSAWNAEVQSTLTSIITDSGYDIGHMFGADGGGGNAGCIGCVCVNGQKGSGITSPGNAIPQGDSFDIDYVAHEMGHQMGGNHTFTFSTENNAVNVEPGSGSTIMAYAGITGTTDVQAHSNDYYSYASIQQIQTNLATKSCPVTTAITHGAPVMNAGVDYTIPKGTPFKLIGSGTDSGSSVITYCWEESDDATISSVAATAATASFPSATKTNGPNFRSFSPVSVPYRYFPSLQTVLGNTLSSTWEATSTVARALNFTLTGRDNVVGGGQTGKDAMIVTVGTTGPFDVTSQAVSGISWTQGSTQTVTWTVNGTTALVGSTNVDILLSTDGGLNFGTTLASAVPNNGSALITVPNIAAASCRIMVKPTGNIYYDINPVTFSIGYDCFGFTVTPNLAIADGTAANVGGAIASTTNNYVPNITINNLKLRFNTNHTWIGDLVLKLKHPDGTSVTFWSRGCNNPQNSGINAIFYDGAPVAVCGSPTTGDIQPATYSATAATPTSFAVFNGKTSSGTWTLTAQDMYNGDSGTIVSWGIDFGCTLETENFGLENFSIFPNPNNGTFTVKFNTTSSNDVSISVHDMRGREIFSKSYQHNGFFNENMQLSGVQSGVYLVNVQDGNRKEVRKIIVE